MAHNFSSGSSLGANGSQRPIPNTGGSAAQQSVMQTVGSEFLKVGQGIGQAIGQGVSDFVSDTGFGKALRAVNLLGGVNKFLGGVGGNAEATWGANNELDWRVRLSVPSNMAGSAILKPLSETGGMVFPYTPQVMIQHSANYNSIDPVHSNYPYFAYQNSRVNALTVMGDFVVENALEGEYWIACVHLLRSVTKMAYGNSSNKGAPPPIVHLNGYGDYVFKNVPCIVTEFTVQLDGNTDYLQVRNLGASGSWVPISSTISVTLQPIYSRKEQTQFSLDAFVRGSYIVTGKGFL